MRRFLLAPTGSTGRVFFSAQAGVCWAGQALWDGHLPRSLLPTPHSWRHRGGHLRTGRPGNRRHRAGLKLAGLLFLLTGPTQEDYSALRAFGRQSSHQMP